MQRFCVLQPFEEHVMQKRAMFFLSVFGTGIFLISWGLLPGTAAIGGEVETAKFFQAVSRGDEAVVQSFLEDKKNLEQRDARGRTPLISAILSNYKKAVQVLVDNGANIF
jgi:ankyrin repeat protein